MFQLISSLPRRGNVHQSVQAMPQGADNGHHIHKHGVDALPSRNCVRAAPSCDACTAVLRRVRLYCTQPWERAALASSGGPGSLPSRSPSTEGPANGAAARPSASEGGGGGGGWRPPPVPQPSLRLGKQGGSGSPAPSVDGSLAGSSA